MANIVFKLADQDLPETISGLNSLKDDLLKVLHFAITLLAQSPNLQKKTFLLDIGNSKTITWDLFKQRKTLKSELKIIFNKLSIINIEKIDTIDGQRRFLQHKRVSSKLAVKKFIMAYMYIYSHYMAFRLSCIPNEQWFNHFIVHDWIPDPSESTKVGTFRYPLGYKLEGVQLEYQVANSNQHQQQQQSLPTLTKRTLREDMEEKSLADCSNENIMDLLFQADSHSKRQKMSQEEEEKEPQTPERIRALKGHVSPSTYVSIKLATYNQNKREAKVSTKAANAQIKELQEQLKVKDVLLKESADMLKRSIRLGHINIQEVKQHGTLIDRKYFEILFGVQRIGGMVIMEGQPVRFAASNQHLASLVNDQVSYAQSLESIKEGIANDIDQQEALLAKLQDMLGEKDACIVCFKEYNLNEQDPNMKKKYISCGHHFHTKCIFESYFCPHCKEDDDDIVVEDIQLRYEEPRENEVATQARYMQQTAVNTEAVQVQTALIQDAIDYFGQV